MTTDIESTLRRIIREEVRAALAEANRAPPTAANDDDELLTMAEAAQVAKVSKDTLRAWARAGRLQVVGDGHTRRCTRSAVVAAMTQTKQRPAGTPEEEALRLLKGVG